MTGTSHNKPEEIQFICDLRRADVKPEEITKICNAVWKHKVRKETSVKYVWTTWKGDPKYARKPAPPPELVTAIRNAINDPLVARRANELYQIVRGPPTMRPLQMNTPQQHASLAPQHGHPPATYSPQNVHPIVTGAHQQQSSRTQQPTHSQPRAGMALQLSPPTAQHNQYLGVPTLPRQVSRAPIFSSTYQSQSMLPGLQQQGSRRLSASSTITGPQFGTGIGLQGSSSYSMNGQDQSSVIRQNPNAGRVIDDIMGPPHPRSTSHPMQNPQTTKPQRFILTAEEARQRISDAAAQSHHPPTATPRKTGRPPPQHSLPGSPEEAHERAKFAAHSKLVKQTHARLKVAEAASRAPSPLHNLNQPFNPRPGYLAESMNDSEVGTSRSLASPQNLLPRTKLLEHKSYLQTELSNSSVPAHSFPPSVNRSDPPNDSENGSSSSSATSPHFSPRIGSPESVTYSQPGPSSIFFPLHNFTPCMNRSGPMTHLPTEFPNSFAPSHNLPPQDDLSETFNNSNARLSSSFALARNFMPPVPAALTSNPSGSNRAYRGPISRKWPTMPRNFKVLSDVVDRALQTTSHPSAASPAVRLLESSLSPSPAPSHGPGTPQPYMKTLNAQNMKRKVLGTATKAEEGQDTMMESPNKHCKLSTPSPATPATQKKASTQPKTPEELATERKKALDDAEMAMMREFHARYAAEPQWQDFEPSSEDLLPIPGLSAGEPVEMMDLDEVDDLCDGFWDELERDQKMAENAEEGAVKRSF